MTIAEKILKDKMKWMPGPPLEPVQEHFVEIAMREIANDFAKWVGTRGYINRESNPDLWIQQMDTLAEEEFTTEELFQLFNEQIQEDKQ